MAAVTNAINLSINWSVTNGLMTDAVNLQQGITQNAPGESAGVMSVPTTAGGTALPVGSVTTQGYLWLRNLDAANYVQIGIQVSGTFYPVARLKAGEQGIIRVDPGATIYLLANTATIQVQFKLLQD